MAQPEARLRVIAGWLFFVESGFFLLSALVLALRSSTGALSLLLFGVPFVALPALLGLLILKKVLFARPLGCLLAGLSIVAYGWVAIWLSLVYTDYGFGTYFALLFSPVLFLSLAIGVLLFL